MHGKCFLINDHSRMSLFFMREVIRSLPRIRYRVNCEKTSRLFELMISIGFSQITTKSVFTAEDDDSSQSLAALIAAKTEPKVLGKYD